MSASTNPFDEDVTPPASAGSGVDLAAFDQDYASAEVEDFDRVPDGKYQTKVEKACLAKSREKGIPMIKWQLGVISGAHAGRKIFKNSVITKDSLRFVKGDLEKLGVKLDRFSDLEKRLPSVIGKTIEASVVTKAKDGGPEYTNIYFNRSLSIPSGGGTGDVPWA